MSNCYEDATRADAYASLGFANTYHLAFRDVPEIVRKHVNGRRALDFGSGTGRSTRFLRDLGFSTTGVDIAPEMIAKARELDPSGDYRLTSGEALSELPDASFDLALCAFPLDNTPGFDRKVRILKSLRRVLVPSGRIVNVVSSPEIYTHEWASFSTRDFPENRNAKTGDIVRIVTTDFGDRRPTDDILWSDEAYAEVYAAAGVKVIEARRPLATGEEPYAWVSETTIAPWVIYVLAP